MTKRNPRLSILTYGIIAYMMLGFSWWSFLLYTKNRDAYKAKVELQAIIAAAKGDVASTSDFVASPTYQQLRRDYRRQEWMILGESLVLIFSLLIGMYIIHRAYQREVSIAKQQRNFLLAITHELKSPIAGIRLVLETFLRRDLPTDKMKQMSKNALKETGRLTDLVEDLLLSAKLEQAYQLHAESVDLAGMLKEQVAEKEIKYPNAQFHLHLDEIPFVLQGDRSGLTSVVVNLLENAAKYSQPDPEIMVRLYRKDQKAILEIADNGIGISKAERSKIFTKFYRVGNEDTRRAKGTGLGLYIVDEIVRAHGGKIVVTANNPKGTIFAVSLPTENSKSLTVKRQPKDDQAVISTN